MALSKFMANYESTRDRFATPYANTRLSEKVSAFLNAVYGWMCLGLMITAIAAWYVASAPALVTSIATNRPIFWALVIAQLGIVFALSARVDSLAPSTASVLFVVYSALTG